MQTPGHESRRKIAPPGQGPIWESEDTAAVEEAFRAVNEAGDGCLEAAECAKEIVAGEIVAALLGKPAAIMPEGARRWIDPHRSLHPSALLPSARAALQRIRASSELQKLWDESDDAPGRHVALDDLLTRLVG